MLTYLGQAIVHAIIAAGVVEALLRVWRLEPPDARLTCRLLALAVPSIALPVFAVLAPFRTAPWFAERWAVFSMAQWHQFRVAGIGLDAVAIASLGAMGIVLYLLDLVPALRMWLVDRALPLADEPAMLARLSGEVELIRERTGQEAPSIRLVPSASPVLLCSGLTRVRLVVSTGAVAALDDAQLRAGLAHEMAHALHGDPLLGWVLMAIRTLLFFSPATQFMARSTVEELERRADDRSVMLVGDRLAMAGALIRLFTAEHATAGPVRKPRRVASWLHLGRTAAIERRCRRLLAPRRAQGVRFWPLQPILAAISIVVLLFFVV